ncbi:hypothetical protein TYRP_004823 [Tyrophagus putrescentiae]|nr:hypothetical protein TYRP_004823 [Tyrophagus putrescentiae]
MVNLTQICMKYMPVYVRRPEARSVFFRRQALFRLTGTFYGLSRNTWRNAIRKWRKTMEYKVEYRQRRAEHLKDLYAQRLLASVEEHDFKMEYFLTSLTQCNIELSRKSLSLLATYEPRTFESLVDLAKTNFHEVGDSEISRNVKPSNGVITRDMLKN